MRVASVLVLGVLLVGALSACMSRTREIHVTNETDEPIAVHYVINAPAFGDLWEIYERARVGDDDSSGGCDLCSLERGATDFIVAKFADSSRLRIIARSTVDGKIVYLEAMTGKDLRERDWTVVIR